MRPEEGVVVVEEGGKVVIEEEEAVLVKIHRLQFCYSHISHRAKRKSGLVDRVRKNKRVNSFPKKKKVRECGRERERKDGEESKRVIIDCPRPRLLVLFFIIKVSEWYGHQPECLSACSL